MRFQCSACGGIVAVDNTDLDIDVQCEHCGAVITTPATRTSPGAVISDFIIQKELGRGGMGVVYLSHQISLDRSAALKILSDNLASDAQFVVNFIKEARAAAKLNHPHIVQAYAVGEDDGIFYFAMEDIDGKTMKKILQEYKVIPCPQALMIIQQIAEALNYAWQEAKLIHRDIKPDNIMLTSSGRAKLSDLGLASIAGEIDDMNDDEIMGTPQYISPEHLTGAPMDARSDIYSLGATFYHFVTGQFPYTGKTPDEVAQMHLTATLTPPNQVNPRIPQDVNDIIMKMMQRNPANRYQTAEELIDDIRKARHDAGNLISVIKFPAPGTEEPVPERSKSSTDANAGGKKLTVKGSGKGGKRLTMGGNGKTSTFTAIDRQKRGKSQKKNTSGGALKAVLLILGVLILLGGFGAGGFFLVKHLRNKGGEKANETQKIVTPKEHAVQEILAQLKFKNEADEPVVKRKCEDLFLHFPLEESDAESLKTDYGTVLEFYHQRDEKDIALARSDVMEKYAAGLEQKKSDKAAIEKAEQTRLEQERLAKEQAEKDRIAKERAEKAAQAAEEKAIREATESLLKWKKDVATTVFKSDDAENPEESKEKILAALQEYQDNLAKLKENPNPKIQEMVPTDEGWISILTQELNGAMEIHAALTTDFNKHVQGVEMTDKSRKVRIERVDEKKRLRYGTMAKPLSKLTRAQREELNAGIIRKLNKEDDLWLYYLLTGETETAEKTGQNSEIYKMLKKAMETPGTN